MLEFLYVLCQKVCAICSIHKYTQLVTTFSMSTVIPKTTLMNPNNDNPSIVTWNYNYHFFYEEYWPFGTPFVHCLWYNIDVQEKAAMYQKILLGTMQELSAKEEQIKKLESMKRDPHCETSGMCTFNKGVVTFHLTFYSCRRGRCRSSAFRGQS